jgi:hypothetical protein
LSFEKVFDIMEKPAGTDELINKIISDGKEFEFMMNQRNVNYFEIENGETVILKKEYLANITEQNTAYIVNEKQAKAYEDLQEFATIYNRLHNLKISNHFKDLLFEKLLDVHYRTGEATVNPYFTTHIY